MDLSAILSCLLQLPWETVSCIATCSQVHVKICAACTGVVHYVSFC